MSRSERAARLSDTAFGGAKSASGDRKAGESSAGARQSCSDPEQQNQSKKTKRHELRGSSIVFGANRVSHGGSYGNSAA